MLASEAATHPALLALLLSVLQLSLSDLPPTTQPPVQSGGQRGVHGGQQGGGVQTGVMCTLLAVLKTQPEVCSAMDVGL